MAIATSAAVGDDFSWQVSAGADRLEIGDSVETNGTALNATYFFPPADDGRGPYSHAAFLSRSSHIGIAAHRDEEVITTEFTSPITGPITSVSETETQIWSISGRYVLPTSGWYVGAGYHAGDGDPESSPILDRSIEIEGYALHFGKYLSASTSLSLAWDSTDSRSEIVASGCFAYPVCVPISGHVITAEQASLRFMHIGTIGGLSYAASGNATSRSADVRFLPAVLLEPAVRPNAPVPPFGLNPGVGGFIAAPPPPSFPSLGRSRKYASAVEVFPTARLGVRAGYSRWDGDPQFDDAYDISVEWFLLREVSARVSFERTNRNFLIDEWSEIDSLNLTLAGRF